MARAVVRCAGSPAAQLFHMRRLLLALAIVAGAALAQSQEPGSPAASAPDGGTPQRGVAPYGGGMLPLPGALGGYYGAPSDAGDTSTLSGAGPTVSTGPVVGSGPEVGTGPEVAADAGIH
jgi:hypothetical protein